VRNNSVQVALSGVQSLVDGVLPKGTHNIFARIVDFDDENLVHGQDRCQIYIPCAAAACVPHVHGESTVGVVDLVDELRADLDRLEVVHRHRFERNSCSRLAGLVASSSNSWWNADRGRLALKGEIGADFECLDPENSGRVEQDRTPAVGLGTFGPGLPPVSEELDLNVDDAGLYGGARLRLPWHSSQLLFCFEFEAWVAHFRDSVTSIEVNVGSTEIHNVSLGLSFDVRSRHP
jgi:hypothetical protein